MGKAKKRSPLEPGTKGTHRFNGQIVEVIVVKNGNKLGFKVKDKIFTSPTGAAKFFTKKPVSGWHFWNFNK